MNLKTKLEDWYDDLCYDLRHLRGNIRAFFHSIERWFSYWKVLRTVYDFDWESILEVERHQLIRVRDAISKYQDHVDWEQDVRWMNIAIKLLDIIKEDGCSELVGRGFRTEPYKDGLYRVVEDPDSKWVLPVYVNTANSHRFWSIDKSEFEDPRSGPLMRDHLRIEKAWHLYHKIRTYKMRSWWD